MPDGPDCWSRWIPAIVIEVVSPSSRDRDYGEKPDEYLQFGVREYWIVDEEQQRFTAMVRSQDGWQTCAVKPTDSYSCRLLPGLDVLPGELFAVAHPKPAST